MMKNTEYRLGPKYELISKEPGTDGGGVKSCPYFTGDSYNDNRCGAHCALFEITYMENGLPWHVTLHCHEIILTLETK